MNSNFFKKHFFFSGWLNTWRPYFLFFLIIFIIYGQTLFFGLTYLDDNTLILDKQEVLRDFRNINTLFSTDAFFSDNKLYYRPMLNLSFMVDAQFGPLNYAVYHISNLLWHLLAVSLIFLILKRLFKKPQLAFYLALLFSVHPVLTQAVAWLPGRNDSLVAVFILLAFWFFLNFVDKYKLSSFLLYLFFFWLALLSKETSVFFPLLLIVYFYTIGKEKKVARLDQGMILIGSAAVGFIWFLMRYFALQGGQISTESALISVFHNLPAAVVMGAKMILPFNLSVLPVAVDTSFVLSLIAWPALILFIFLSRRKNWDYLIFGVAWFLIFFLPPFVVSTAAPYLLEHRLYLPLIGFLIALFSFDSIRNLDWNKKVVWSIAVLILCLFSSITIWHSRDFKDQLTFWKAAVKDSPHSPLANRNLGVMYYFNNDLVNSEKYYKASSALNPTEPMVHNNLGVIYMGQKKFKEAELEFNKELEVNPGYDKAIYNLNDLKSRESDLLILKK
jgi:tetratricopeptide (TPR) repeat protein